MTFAWCAVHGSVRYEARMAMRGKVLWLSLLPLTALAVLLVLTSPKISGQADAGGRVGNAIILFTTFALVGLGAAMAGRFDQHSKPGLTELLDTTPGGGTGRLVGVLIGALAVGLAPVATAIVLLGAWWSAWAGSVTPLATAVLGLVTVIAPAALAITSLSALLGLLVPVPLARVLVVAVWFWATQLSPLLVPVPTPTGTVLSPLGGYPAVAWLGAQQIWARRQRTGLLSPPPDAGSALLNIVLVMACAAAFFAAARLIMIWRANGHTLQGGDR